MVAHISAISSSVSSSMVCMYCRCINVSVFACINTGGLLDFLLFSGIKFKQYLNYSKLCLCFWRSFVPFVYWDRAFCDILFVFWQNLPGDQPLVNPKGLEVCTDKRQEVMGGTERGSDKASCRQELCLFSLTIGRGQKCLWLVFWFFDLSASTSISDSGFLLVRLIRIMLQGLTVSRSWLRTHDITESSNSS